MNLLFLPAILGSGSMNVKNSSVLFTIMLLLLRNLLCIKLRVGTGLAHRTYYSYHVIHHSEAVERWSGSFENSVTLLDR
jgi:hypothetical protein